MQSLFERQYLHLLSTALDKGVECSDRTGTGTRALFGQSVKHDWADGFPVITHRTLNPRSAFGEMACFIKGLTDIADFEAHGCNWWRANLEDWNKRNNKPDNTDLGPIYGSKWRDFHGTDQLKVLLNEARRNPTSRRLLATAWDPSDQAEAVLPPCHYSFQIFIDTETKSLDLLFTMRSVDIVLGMPADFAAYGFLQLAVCRELGLEPRALIGHFADTHVYLNHLDGAKQILETQVDRALPQWGWSRNTSDIFNLHPDDLIISKFEQGPSIRFKMAV
jgi:thymidylate synthase